MTQKFTGVRTRFAPSPTGFMHVGNLRTALFAWLLARSQHGTFILRIEDTDQARYVAGATQVIYDTLARAGLTHDEGPDKDGGFGPYVQSERKHLYLPFAEELVSKGAAYYCFCDKEDKDDDEPDEHAAVGYDGRCRHLSPETVAANLTAGKPYVIRQKVAKEGGTTYTDAVFGDITIENKVLDDQILIKRDGMPTYNFANVVDDHLMQITHVVRGCEYLSSTPKYNMLYEAFGWQLPQYVHLPLIMGRDAEGNISKLSKRHGAVSFESLGAEGYLPEAIINYIALLGWSSKSDKEIFSLSELVATFNVAGLNKAPAVFDYEKLKWMNGEYLKALPAESFAALALPFSGIAGTALEASYAKIAAILHQRTAVLSEIPEKIAFLHKLPPYSLEMFSNKKSKSTPEVAKGMLPELIAGFAALTAWDNDSLMNVLTSFAERRNCKFTLPMWGVRIGVAGQTVTPGGATELMDILGREESLRRLACAVEFLRTATNGQ